MKYTITPEEDQQHIISKASSDIAKKYLAGQLEHKSKLPTGSLGFFATAAREEAVDQISYTHHILLKIDELRGIITDCDLGEITSKQAIELMRPILSNNPPESNK